jgi:hypothetical protein
LALTAAEWAKQKHMGEQAIQHCRAYALEAERRIGELLQETERANAARDKKKAELPGVTPPPTLADLGLTKRESAEAQMIAGLPQAEFEQIKAGKKSKKQIRKEKILKKAQKKVAGYVLAKDEQR